MRTSDTIADLASALAKAQGAMKNATLNKTNPHFKSQYADLAAVRDATIPALAENGLSIVQIVGADGDAPCLFTRLLHKSGEWIEGIYPLPITPLKSQELGSAITYARRYSWAAMCGIAAEEDDDANAAQSAQATTRAPAAKQAAPKPQNDEDAFFKATGASLSKMIAEATSVDQVDEVLIRPDYEELMEKKPTYGNIVTKRAKDRRNELSGETLMAG